MAVLKYYDKLQSLTSHPFFIYRPKRGEKTEVFRATGQKGYRKFDVGFIPKINPNATLSVSIDRSRPVGSRMVLTDTRSSKRQRYYSIAPDIILNAVERADEDGAAAVDYIAEVLDEYSDDANFYMIRAGEYFMWGAARGDGGHLDRVSERIYQLMNDYGANNFDAHDKNSHYFGNWFNGVMAFTSAQDAYPLMAERARARDEYLEKRFQKVTELTRRLRFRKGKGGKWLIFLDGKYIGVAYTEEERDNIIADVAEDLG